MKIYSNVFSYIPFLHQKHITTHIKPNLILGSVFFFSRYRPSNGQPIFSFENLQNFV